MPADRPGVAAIIGSANGKASVVVARQRRGARSAGISANTLVRAASEVLGGKGGGKDDVAQGGGADASKAAEALAAIRRALAERTLAPDGGQLAGVRLGVDPGDARIGVASSDPAGILATPVETVPRGDGDLDRLAALVRGARRGARLRRPASLVVREERDPRPVRFERSRASWRPDSGRFRSGCATSA